LLEKGAHAGKLQQFAKSGARTAHITLIEAGVGSRSDMRTSERDIAMRRVSKRLRLLATVLALGLAGYGRGHGAQGAHARAYRASGATRPQDNLSTLPMRFALHHERPTEACGANCRLLVSASGMITADTPRDFENFAHGRDLRGATVVLDSRGGSVL